MCSTGCFVFSITTKQIHICQIGLFVVGICLEYVGENLAVVLILVADDIIFAEIITTLDLNDFKYVLAGVFEAMLRPERNIDTLTLFEVARVSSYCGFGDPGYHCPMLAALFVRLK